MNYLKALQYVPLATRLVSFISSIKDSRPEGFSEPLSIKGVRGTIAWTPDAK